MTPIDLDDPRLTAYVLNELAPEDRATVEAAAAADPALRAELESLQQTIGLLAEELGGEPAQSLTPAQRAAVERSARPPLASVPPPPLWQRLAGGLVQLALMALPVVILMSAGTARYQSVGGSDAYPAGADWSKLGPRPADVPRAIEPAPPKPPHFDVSANNQYALLPRGQSVEDRTRVERELAAKPPPRPPTADLRRNAVDTKVPYYGLRGAADEIHAWVRGGDRGVGNRLRSHNDYYVDYTQRGHPSGGYAYSGSGRVFAPTSGAPSTDAGAQSRAMQAALQRYQDAEARGDAAAATAAFQDYNRSRAALAELRASDPTRPPSPAPLIENAFLPARENPLSTFSIDVDTASYAKVRRYLTEGGRPPVDEVRVEELINYFPYSYPEPDAGEPLTVAAEVAGAPWAAGHRLVRVALKARSIVAARRPASNLVFLIDVSGSMEAPDRLPLVAQSLELLVPQLTGEDRVAIVVYAGSSGLVLPSTAGDRKEAITRAIRDLRAGGGTNGGAGIELAYRTAQEHFIRGGNNRVVLATDGDFNVGVTSGEALEELIRAKAKSGVFLSVLGYGMGNHQDATLERLADRGNGNHAYIDSLQEARKVLVDQMTGTLVTVAKDVKIQVAFDPAHVARYRLIGYENRALAAQDFADDAKDAGELGAGHTVTALYEIVPAAGAGAGPMVTVKLRYQPPAGGASRELAFPVTDRGAAFDAATADFRWAAAVAGFGMELRGSAQKGDLTLDGVLAIAEGARGADPGGHRAELIDLVKRAASVR